MTAEPLPEPLSAACIEVRPATAGDACAGVQPRYVASPASVAEASAVMAAAAGLGLAVLPRGTGTRLAWGSPPRRCDLVVDTLRPYFGEVRERRVRREGENVLVVAARPRPARSVSE